VATAAGWRAVVLAAAFGIGVSLAVLGGLPLAAAAAVLLGGAGLSVVIPRRKGLSTLLPLLVAICCAAGLARGALSLNTAGSGIVQAAHGGPAILLGTVREGTGSRRTGSQVVVDVERVVHTEGDVAVHAGVLATLRSGPAVLPGDRVRLDVTGLRAPGSDVAGSILAREGIDAVARSPVLAVQAEGGPSPAQLLAVVRGRLAAAVEAALPEPAAALVEGIVFGIRRPLAPDVTTALQDAGLAHVLAISGLKVVLVAGMVSALCAALALAPRARLLLTAVTVGGYVVLCGATPAAVRSALMAGAAWGLEGTGRSPDPLPLLSAVAAGMLLVDPGLCADAGFQLSVLGTLGIVMLATPIAERLRGPRLLREPFAVTLAAQLVTLPVMASTFGVISLVGPLANALAVPLLPALIVSGALGAVMAAVLPAAGPVLLSVAGGLALVIAGIAARAAAFPLAAFHVAGWPPVYVLAEVGGLVAAGLTWLVLRRLVRRQAIAASAVAARMSVPPPPCAGARRESTVRALPQRFRLPSRRVAAAIAAAVAVATGAVVVVAAGRPDGRLHVVVLDAGGARAVVVRTGSGGLALVDTGSDPQRLVQSLGAALPPLTRTIDLLVLTGGDRAATGGLAGLGDRYAVGRAVVPAAGLGSHARSALTALGDRGTAITTAEPDSAWTWGGASWWLLSPDGGDDEGHALEVSGDGGRVLMLGNLTVSAQEELAAARGSRLSADLLVTTPAGTVAPALAEDAAPRLVAIPDGRSTRTTATAALLSGPAVRRTSQSGTLTYVGSDGGLVGT